MLCEDGWAWRNKKRHTLRAPGLQGEDRGKVEWGGGGIARHWESQGEGQGQDRVHGQAQGSRAALWHRQWKDKIPTENERKEPCGLPGREEHDQMQWVSK